MLPPLAYCFTEHAAAPGHTAPQLAAPPCPGQCGHASPPGHDVASLPGHAAPPGHDATPPPPGMLLSYACHSTMLSQKYKLNYCTHGSLFRHKVGFSYGRCLYIWPLISSHYFKNIF